MLAGNPTSGRCSALLTLLLLCNAGCVATHATHVPRSLQDCRECPRLVVVPAGHFVAGSTPGETAREGVDAELAAREQPATETSIKNAFALGRFSVTRGEFRRFVAATGWKAAGPCGVLADGPRNRWIQDPQRNWRDPGFAQSDRHPVVCVNFADASAYADWLSARTGHRYRLPSGSEWEYAARAGATTARYWGDSLAAACRFANVSDRSRERAHNAGAADASRFINCHDGFVTTAPVGHFAPNAFGLYDMLGNVWQWTTDCGDATPADAARGASAGTSHDCSAHLDRGGSWTNSPRYLRLAARHPDLTDTRTSVLGFRVVRDLD